jgi:magnesium chelatase family protein
LRATHEVCRLDDAGRGLVKAAMLAGASTPAPAWLQMSARAFHHILKLARTIADLAGSERIETARLVEVVQSRPRRAVKNLLLHLHSPFSERNLA